VALVKPAWQGHNRNYDPTELAFWTATKGFTLGESLLGGPDLLGADGSDVSLPGTFTSLQIEEKATVEDGLFVHRDTQTCQLSATLPAHADLKGQRLAIAYGAYEIWRGTIREASWSESVDIGRDYLPGNTPTKTYRVVLVATNGEEQFAQAPTPARNFTTSTPLATRIASWTGLSVTTETDPGDFPLNWANIAQDTGDSPITNYASWWRYVTISDQPGALGDTLRQELRLYNLNYRRTPAGIVLRQNHRWLARSTPDSNAPLHFTDTAISSIPVAGDAYIGSQASVGYTERQYGDDPGMWTGAASVAFSNGGTDYTAGPWRAGSNSGPAPVVDLGPAQWTNFAFVPERTARIIMSTLPLKSRVRSTTRSLSTPFQSVVQLLGVVPGLAKVTADGVTEDVAVLGRTHSITPDRWTISYDTGPHHLLDRESDLDPGGALNGSIVTHGSLPNTAVIGFTQPAVTDFQPYLRIWYVDTATDPGMDVGMVSWGIEGQHLLSNNLASYPWTEGFAFTQNMPNTSFPIGVPVKVFAQYTSDPDPMHGLQDPNLREGQPIPLGTYTRP
jgi:hypothetical protein